MATVSVEAHWRAVIARVAHPRLVPKNAHRDSYLHYGRYADSSVSDLLEARNTLERTKLRWCRNRARSGLGSQNADCLKAVSDGLYLFSGHGSATRSCPFRIQTYK